MRKFIIALSLSLLLACVAAPVRADDKGEDKTIMKAIENRYWDIKTAIKSGDKDHYKTNFAPGYSNTDLGGTTRSLNKVVDALGVSVPDDSRKENTTVTSLKWEGEKAVVGQSYELTTMRKAVNGNKIEFRMVTTSTDTWVKKDDKWLLEKSVAETGDVFINGNKMAHRVRGEALPPAKEVAPEEKPKDEKSKEEKPAGTPPAKD